MPSMTPPSWLTVADAVSQSLRNRQPVLALESTLIAHGLPYPANLETARQSEETAQKQGVTPATIAVWQGQPTVGLNPQQLETFARAAGVWKASRRDLAAAVGLNRHAATTVSATMALAHLAGIEVFATGGIGGAHKEPLFDISADLIELAKTPVLVVCSGAKSILDLPRTLEILETLGVPVLGYQTDELPAFIVASGGDASRLRCPVSVRVESPDEVARIFRAHVQMGGGGMVLAQACPPSVALKPAEFDRAMAQAELDATADRITGPAITPFLLTRLAELTQGKSLIANQALILNNVLLAAQVARALISLPKGTV